MQELGTARLVGDYEDGSPEWHELRKTGIGGSDVAGIIGVSPWSSPFKVWAVKTGRLLDNVEQTEAMEWGHLLEPVILAKFAKKHPELAVVAGSGTWAHKDRPWQLANLDGMFQTDDGEKGIIEIKTARYEDDWVNGVPAYYQTQVLWYLQTFGFKKAYVAVLFSGSKYREFEIIADEFIQDTYLAEVEKFREYLASDTHPDFDGSFATLETVRELHPNIDPDAECELGDLGVHYFNAVKDFELAQSKLNEMKSRVVEAMGNAKRGLINGLWLVTRQSRNGGTPFLVNKKG